MLKCSNLSALPIKLEAPACLPFNVASFALGKASYYLEKKPKENEAAQPPSDQSTCCVSKVIPEGCVCACVCLCVCVHMCLCLCVWLCVYTCRSQRMTAVIPQELLTLHFGDRVSHWPEAHWVG